MLIFYAQHGCEACSEAESEIQSNNLSYKKCYITASSNPGFLILWDGVSSMEIPKSTIPYVPAYYDKERNLLLCGVSAIEKYLRGEV